MNRIEYTLTAEDLLQFNLYYSSISPNHARQRKRHRILVPVVYMILALLLLREGSHIAATLFTLFAAVWFALSPRWLRKRYCKHYERHIAETAGDVLPRSTVLELLPDGIFSSSHIGETKFRYDAVDRVVENNGYTYVFIGKGMALVLPHDRISKDTIAAFVDEIQRKKQTGEHASAP